jgi:hypothetical protein
VQIEVGNLQELLDELKHLREQRDELQRNQTALVNENRAQDLSCQMRKEYEVGVTFGELGSLSSVPDSWMTTQSLSQWAYEMAIRDRLLEQERLRLGIPRAAVAFLVHSMRLTNETPGSIQSAIDRLLRDRGYQGR